MSTEIVHPPKTIMEAYQSLPEGTLAELIDNAIIMSPAPTPRHQIVLIDLVVELRSVMKKHGGEVFVAPVDVHLDDKSNAVQPDITVILKHNMSIVNLKERINGVPDMLIEILSPGNPKHDQVTKKRLYERFRVKEYWIVNPETKDTTGYKLVNRSFELLTSSQSVINSPLLGVEFKF
ncbi:MAG: Uma2 family endonuclease [Bacteroidota bacterium]